MSSATRRQPRRSALLAALTALTVPLAACAGGRPQLAGAPAEAGPAPPAASPDPATPSADQATRPPWPLPSPMATTPAAAVPASAVRPAGDGALQVVGGSSPPVGSGPLQRYLVEVEGDIGVDPASFASAVERTLGDPRSWTAGGRHSLQRVDQGPVDFRVVLASPSLTDRLCAPLRTAGRYSCQQGERAVVNALRWLSGASSYAGRLPDYRHYIVNHEVGHALGLGHVGCPAPGAPAPVMMQQTKGVGACVAHPWPFG